MHAMNSIRAALVMMCLGAGASSARAQCMEWDDSFWTDGPNSSVTASVVFDDGSGPALFIGGHFTEVADKQAARIAKWNGTSWSALGSGLNSSVYALAVHDDGTGSALYAGGEFTTAGGVTVDRIARWNGTSWSALGTGVDFSVVALAVFDDGTGDALYAGGTNPLLPSSSYRIAKWNGTSWSALGGGVQGRVYSLTAYDDGSGEALYVGGDFTTVDGGISAEDIAKWDGTAWSALGTGLSGIGVSELAVYDDGSGPALYAGGDITAAGGAGVNHIAKWNGTSWSALAGGVQERVRAFAVHDDGSGSSLFAGGEPSGPMGSPESHIRKWNGSAWISVGAVSHTASPSPDVFTLCVFDEGNGPELRVGGDFRKGGPVQARNVATLNGTSWRGLEPCGNGIVEGWPTSFVAYDDGSGPALYTGGLFTFAGCVNANRIARWNGTQWAPVGGGFGPTGTVHALAAYDDGMGTALYAGGTFRTAELSPALRIAKWNGSTWSTVGTGMTSVNDTVRALAVYDDGSGPALYAGGEFTIAGGINAKAIAKWNGASWAPLGTGLALSMFQPPAVYALHVFDDGTGSALYAGGNFATAGGVTAPGIARWNGTSWSALGSGITSFPRTVFALADFDDGAGSALYAGGTFSAAGGMSANRVAKWNGSAWSALGMGIQQGEVYALASFHDGAGPALYAGGDFLTAGGIFDMHRLAKWDGATWTSVGGGVTEASFLADVTALCVFDDGADGVPDLFVGGNFDMAGAIASHGVAKWRGCGPGAGYCFGDGLDPVVTAQCPCANFGDAGHGCANTFSASGGRLIASGTTTPNTLVFSVSLIPNNTLTVGFRNTDNLTPGGVQFGDGVRCQSGTLIRFGAHNSGTAGDSANTWSSATSSVASGLTRYYQVQYRNSATAFCPPETFNITNGYRITW